EDYLQSLSRSAEEFETDLNRDARRSVKTGFVLDQLARQEDLSVDGAELSAYVTEQAQRMRVDPSRLARDLTENNQLGAVAGEVLRAKALDVIAQRARVTDEAGHEVDVKPQAAAESAEGVEVAQAEEAEGEQAETGEPAGSS